MAAKILLLSPSIFSIFSISTMLLSSLQLLWLACFLSTVSAGYLDGSSSGKESIGDWYPTDPNNMVRPGIFGSGSKSKPLPQKGQGLSIRESSSSRNSGNNLRNLGSLASMVKSDGVSVKGNILTINSDYNDWYYLVFSKATRYVLPTSGSLTSQQRRWTSKEDYMMIDSDLTKIWPGHQLLTKFDAAPPECFYDDDFSKAFPDLTDMNVNIWLPVRSTKGNDGSMKVRNLQQKLVYIFDSKCEMLYKSPTLTVFDTKSKSSVSEPRGETTNSHSPVSQARGE